MAAKTTGTLDKHHFKTTESSLLEVVEGGDLGSGVLRQGETVSIISSGRNLVADYNRHVENQNVKIYTRSDYVFTFSTPNSSVVLATHKVPYSRSCSNCSAIYS
jgi:hypothetical protein